MNRYLISSVAVLSLSTSGAFAQSDPTQMAHVTASNELGVIEYCQTKGWTDQAAVDAQKKAISQLPTTSNSAGVTAAESTGKQGIFDVNGSQTSLSQMASSKNTSVQSICSQLGTSVKNAAASMSSMPTMPQGMPAMPQGMPSIPNGMPTAPGGSANGSTSQ